MIKNTFSFTALVLLTSLAFPTAGKADVVNGSFEEGFKGWETIGETTIETEQFGSGPVEGKSQAFLSTAYQELLGFDTQGNEIIGGDAAIASFVTGFENLEEFLNLPSSFLSDNTLSSLATGEIIEGSAIKQTFKANAGQSLTFAWNFLTEEFTQAVDNSSFEDFNDFAFVSLQRQSDLNTVLLPLADTLNSSFQFSNHSLFFGETGFQEFSYTFEQSDTYTLGVGVVDVGDGDFVSGLLVDQVDVPETSPAVGLVALGALGSLSIMKRRWKNS
ncbi:hypothetical protein H6F90_00450 [Trichocoleus sp. FACHB-591]|uniref:hypothetical protein n=1 Tax=Trichocoleus sp. FACHB-591 TaxID=2692872 RepID=UPI001684310D|nr:hypothetical protein [Trichocoleus sp. FACHB-591]MBD2093625.1 hypothetical protein [Trichocoleus sp. FACHB-591]